MQGKTMKLRRVADDGTATVSDIEAMDLGPQHGITFRVDADVEDGDEVTDTLPNGKSKTMRLREVQVLQSPFGSGTLDHTGAKYDVISGKAALGRATAKPVAEILRILMLGASPEGDLRITREHTRIRKAVEAALHRDFVEFDVRLSATAADLQEGIAKFRPHVVHFAGHGGDKLIALERDLDEQHEGVVVTESALAAACAATDEPPKLVVLNACDSAATADALVEHFAPLAIGMRGSVADVDAMVFATSFYSSVANGQSVWAAHLAGRAGVELQGGDHEAPYLAVADGIEPKSVKLVAAPKQ
ncbi:CHAT domain-containing protein [Nocardia sp.]|uniref:CHAT domain-containing protein n=1 Tax=Nocardia sp. TaxID=1821 RepID=UPI002627268F|nr:CHAT domain-containing protein [Nocardia sp.]